MSTYYFIVCKECQEVTDAASRTAGGYCHLVNSPHTLLPFIIAHSNCADVHIFDEHKWYSQDFEMYTEWTEDNVSELVTKACNEDRWLEENT